MKTESFHKLWSRHTTNGTMKVFECKFKYAETFCKLWSRHITIVPQRYLYKNPHRQPFMNPIHYKSAKILTVQCIRWITVRTKHLKTHSSVLFW